MPTPALKSFDRSIDALSCILEAGEPIAVKEVSERIGAPISTVYRYLAALTGSGLIFRRQKGVYLPNPAFLRNLARFDANEILIAAVRPHLKALSAELESTVHFGVLEDDMVNYIVKVAWPGDRLFTQENRMLEAYCSAIGKVLLADLPSARLTEYLSAGVFPKLTEQTITKPSEIRAELTKTRARAYGVDDGEVDDRLYCLAVPVRDGLGRLLGAMSASSRDREVITPGRAARLKTLRSYAQEIGAVFGNTGA